MKIILIFLISINLFADIKYDMLNLYKNKEYSKACAVGFKNLYHHTKDEVFLSLYSFSCLQSDYINRLAVPITLLHKSKESRSNSTYFAVVLMQKKMLYHALVDNYDISSLNMPSTDYVLSKVFDLYSQLKNHKPKDFYIFNDKNNKNISYKLYLLHENKLNKMVIEEFYDKILVKRHIYW